MKTQNQRMLKLLVELSLNKTKYYKFEKVTILCKYLQPLDLTL